jgi:hypothetical protein
MTQKIMAGFPNHLKDPLPEEVMVMDPNLPKVLHPPTGEAEEEEAAEEAEAQTDLLIHLTDLTTYTVSSTKKELRKTKKSR